MNFMRGLFMQHRLLMQRQGMFKTMAIAAIALLTTAGTAAAHHSFAAEFDLNKPLKVHGVITKMDWINPHSWIYVDVKDANGKVTNWHFELGSPNSLFRNGWRKDAVPVGVEVDILAYQAKTGESVGNATMIKLPGGKELLTGGSAPESGKQ
jgi:hypothetical protein